MSSSFLSTGSLVLGFNAALGHAATTALYVGSSPSAFNRLAADTMAVTFAPDSTRFGPRRSPLCLPGYQLGSESTFRKNSLMELEHDAPPFGLPSFVFCTRAATSDNKPCSPLPSPRQTSRRAQAFACSRAHNLPSGADNQSSATSARRKYVDKTALLEKSD